MKSNLPVIILLLVCLGLGIVVWMQYQTHTVQATREQAINSYSNNYTVLSNTLKDEVLVRESLETNLTATQLAAANERAAAETNLQHTLSDLKSAQAEAAAAKAAVAQAATDIAAREKRIAELVAQNTDLDKQATALHTELDGLKVQIAATKKQFDDATKDKTLLSEELVQLELQKQELERRLSDLAALKEQVQTLKDNLSTARRLTWMQHGLYDTVGKKGGELLISPPKPSSPDTGKSLDVELHQGGGVKINSPTATNAPPGR